MTGMDSSLVALVLTPWKYRGLLWELAKRDFIGRYKGSSLGIIWSLINPLLLLVIYAFVFGVIFKSRWGHGVENGKGVFAIVLFSGMIIHGFFAECLIRSPGLIVAYPNYVTKVVFPLEILSWMSLISAVFHMLVSFFVLLLFCGISGTPVYWGTLLMPIILLPLFLMMLGFSWFFSAIGVYFRDLSQFVGMISTVTLFLAPVFYSADTLPAPYREWLIWNPITLPIVELREAMLWNKSLAWDSWGVSLIISLLICQTGFWWFQKTRRGFSDAI